MLRLSDPKRPREDRDLGAGPANLPDGYAYGLTVELEQLEHHFIPPQHPFSKRGR